MKTTTQPNTPRPLGRGIALHSRFVLLPRKFLHILALLALTGSVLTATAGTFAWTVGSRYDTNVLNDNNLWSNPLNWSPYGVPGGGDTALVGAVPYGNPDPVGSLTLAGLQISGGAAVTVSSLTVDQLALANGNLYGGTVMFSGGSSNAWSWAGGAIAGTFTIQAGVRADFSGPGAQVFTANTTLNNAGEVAWSGGSLNLGYGAVIHNTGAFLASTDDILFSYTGGAPAPAFWNEGLFRKTAGAGTLTFRADNGGVYLTNTAVVDIQTGTLSLPGNADFGDGGTLRGGGTISVDGQVGFFGTSTLTNGTTLQLAGVLTGHAAVLTGAGTFRWSNGRLQGGLVLDSGLTNLLQGAAAKTVAPGARVLQRGLTQWQESGPLYLGYGTVWENAGQFDVLNDSYCYLNTGGSPLPEFLNTGRLRKLVATGTSTWRLENGGVRFSGSGAVEVQSGTLQLDGGGALTNATFQIAGGSMVGFGANKFALQAGAAFSGGGLARVNGGTLSLAGIPFDLATNTTLELASGSLAGAGTFTGTGLLAWTGGNLAGQFTVPASLQFDISGANVKYLQPNAALTNFATAVWRDAGDLDFGYATTFHNAGNLEIRNDRRCYCFTGGSPLPLFNNTGTLTKTAGTGTTTFMPDNGGVVLTNTGILDIRSGVLSLTGPAYLGPGGTFAGAGWTSLDGQTWVYGTSHLSTGNLRLTATLTGASGFDGTGTFEWRSGTLLGQLELGPSVTLDLPGSSTKTLGSGARLTHQGLATLTGTGQMNLGFGSAWKNSGVFEARTNGVFYSSTGGSPAPVFNNTGTFRCQAAGSTVNFHYGNGGVHFDNRGTAEVLSGVLVLAGGGANTNGVFQVASGAELDFAALAHEFHDGARLQVEGLARFNGATATFFNTTNTIATAGEINVSSGTLAGTQSVAGPGLLRWTGGTLAGAHTVVAETGFEISGAASKTLSTGARLNNFASAIWRDAGQISCGYGSVMANAGTLDAQGDSSFYNYTGGAPTPRFENTGILRKSAGTVTSFLPNNGGVIVTNSAVVDAQTGVLSLAGGVQLGAGGSFTGTGITSLDSASTLNGANTIAEVATLRLNSTLSASGRFDGAGTFNWNSGTLNGSLAVAAALSLTSASAKTLSQDSLLSTEGASKWNDGPIYFGHGATLANSGTFEVRCDSLVFNSTGSSPLPVVANSGTFRKLASAGTTTFLPDNGGVTFNNTGTVDLRSGTLQLNAGYVPAAGAPFAYLLSGPASGSDYGRVSRSAMTFNGPLTVTLASGYTPTAGTVFTLASYTTRSGSFGPVTLPALPAPLQWALTYQPTSLELRVLAGAPFLCLTQPAWLPNRTFQATVLGSNVTAVVVQATTNFTDWTPLVTNAPFTGAFPFTDAAAGTITNRFYRAQSQP